MRLCTEAYGAAHVTLASRSSQLMFAWNVYLNESLWRIKHYVAAGRMTVQLDATLADVNATHADLKVAPKPPSCRRGSCLHGKPAQPVPPPRHVSVRADEVIMAVGFQSDVSLINSVGFPNGKITSDTCETSVPGIYNVGIQETAPWTSKTNKRQLSTFIEDSYPMVRKVCKALQNRLHLTSPSSTAAAELALQSDGNGGADSSLPAYERLAPAVD